MAESYHIPVLVEPVKSSLKVNECNLIIDCTCGDAGHSLAFLKAMPGDGRVIAVDLDPEALERARQRMRDYGDRFKAVQGNFKDIKSLVSQLGVDRPCGIFADLGVSRLQLLKPEKGFMYTGSGPLSMRMDGGQGVTAETVVNEFEEEKLARIIKTYGEDRAYRRIAREIVRKRARRAIKTTGELAEIIKNVVRGPYVTKSLARVFQSIRIFVNGEVDNLKCFLPQAIDLLREKGRLAVLTYHSIEDRIVKAFMRAEASDCECPPDFPVCVCGKEARARIIGRPVVPDEAEIARNPKARSSRLRCCEKIC